MVIRRVAVDVFEDLLHDLVREAIMGAVDDPLFEGLLVFVQREEEVVQGDQSQRVGGVGRDEDGVGDARRKDVLSGVGPSGKGKTACRKSYSAGLICHMGIMAIAAWPVMNSLIW